MSMISFIKDKITYFKNRQRIIKMCDELDIMSLKKIFLDQPSQDLKYDYQSLIEKRFGCDNSEIVLNILDEEGNYVADEKRYILYPDILKGMVKYKPEIQDFLNGEKAQRFYAYLDQYPVLYEVLFKGVSSEYKTLNELIDYYFNGQTIHPNLLIRVIGQYQSRSKFKSVIHLYPDIFKNAYKLGPGEIDGLVLICEEILNEHQDETIDWNKELIPYYNGTKITREGYRQIYEKNPYLLNEVLVNNNGKVSRKKLANIFNELEMSFFVFDEETGYIDSQIYTDFLNNKLCKISLTEMNKWFYMENGQRKIHQESLKEILASQNTVLIKSEITAEYLPYLDTIEQKFVKALQLQPSSRPWDVFLTNLFYENKDSFIEYSEENLLGIKKTFDQIYERLNNTNSPEINKMLYNLIPRLALSSNPKEEFNKIVDIFEKNNLPNIGKIFKVFKILSPNYDDITIGHSSPILSRTKISDFHRDTILFSDLLRITIRSNNHELREYLENLKIGSEILASIKDGKIDIKHLSPSEEKILTTYLNHLNTLYNNTRYGQKIPNALTGNIYQDCTRLLNLFAKEDFTKLPDHIVHMFGHLAGYDTVDQILSEMDSTVKHKNLLSKQRALKVMQEPFKIKKGQLIRGIGEKGVDHFQEILQNGSLCGEFLGGSYHSDCTPLDIDLCPIKTNPNSNIEAINQTISKGFGPIWFVINQDERFVVNKQENAGTYKIDDRLELFPTSKDTHWGIRTGIPSSYVDYIIVKEKNGQIISGTTEDLSGEVIGSINDIKLNMVINNTYIPLVNLQGKLLFTPMEFDELRSKTKGIRRFNQEPFQFNEDLNFSPEITEIKKNIPQISQELFPKKVLILEKLSQAFQNEGIKLRKYWSSDITMGSADLIDTGSTGRGTNTSADGDFDFMIRVDVNTNTTAITNSILDTIGISKDDNRITNTHNGFRIKGLTIDGVEGIDLDISYVEKSKSNFYSTDMVLSDELQEIEKQDPEKYQDVIANIIYAKKFLKEHECYKPSHSREKKEGGLGGVGVENWILQNGGSFIKAARSFIEASKNTTFEEFTKKYKVYDFGINFYTGNHDEFVTGNMTAAGYKKMRSALVEFIDAYDKSHSKQVKLSESTQIELIDGKAIVIPNQSSKEYLNFANQVIQKINNGDSLDNYLYIVCSNTWFIGINKLGRLVSWGDNIDSKALNDLKRQLQNGELKQYLNSQSEEKHKRL